MGKLNPPKILFLISSLIYLATVIFDWDYLVHFISKPIIIPSLCFYYWQMSKKKWKLYHFLILNLFFIGDMVVLIESTDVLLFLIFLNSLIYLSLIFVNFRDLSKEKSFKIPLHSIITIAFIFIFLLCLFYVSVLIVFDRKADNYAMIFIYAIILFFLGIQTLYLQLLKNNSYTFYLSIGVLSLIISDLFYILHNYYYPLKPFIFIHILAQVLSLYFMVVYFLEHNLFTLKLEQNEK